MRVSSILVAVAYASTASAVMRIAANSLAWNWTVTEWGAGCSKGACSYDFNVTGIGNGTARPAKPSFKAYCSGQGVGADYRACTNIGDEETKFSVVAKLLQHTSTNETLARPEIQVSLKFTDLNTSSTWWNYTGTAETKYNSFSGPRLNFTIIPDTVFGAA
ncbi:hypothetical protein F5B19DRAFT_198660 [Rostrohypoxylon terebratum]|nr:hypothetical protein F5B19DRAFT_198660 [Rostrohypoxylon terebratum]